MFHKHEAHRSEYGRTFIDRMRPGALWFGFIIP